MNVFNMLEPLYIRVDSEDIKELMKERNPPNTMNMVKPLNISVIFKYIKEHMSDKPYKCSQCDKAFYNTVVYEYIKVHILVRNPMNVINQVNLSQDIHLQIHERTYTGKDLYESNQCGKAFTHCCALHRHERTHASERPYERDQCGKAFPSESHLQCHVRTYQKYFKVTYYSSFV